MTRISGYKGTWSPNRRPYITLTSDCYVSIQGQTSVRACGECNRKLNVNKYLTGVSTEASTDSPPGSATFNMSVPDNDINEFYVENEFVIIPMMEVEIYAKGYYTVGGFPQYYRIFWGVVSSVNKTWDDGTTSISIQCRDILRWWELTNVTLNSAFLDIGKSGTGYQLFQNKFSGMNPYAVIIALARDAMGDFSITKSSFTSYRPEDGAERGSLAQYAKDIMAYWQLKFGNIWNALVLYGTTGQAYTFTGSPRLVSPKVIAQQIFVEEAKNLALNKETSLFKIQPHEIAAFKIDVSRAGDVDFFENEQQSKLAIAQTARDQAGHYEFYCDPGGNIVFKPPFYNMNTIPNKPVSWINDFEIISENLTDSEAEVFTHVTGSGNAFGGVTDWGLSDEITTPRTGVIDWHLLRRYGWRRLDVQFVWAGNPKKLFYHLLDYIDRVNSKRFRGNFTIPMRPEMKMGFPVWVPKYDSFFYVNSISHQYSPGGQATTNIGVVARRQKFVAPSNIGVIEKIGSVDVKYPPAGQTADDTKERVLKQEPLYQITFPSNVSETTVVASQEGQEVEYGKPAIIRDRETGKLLGYPNVVMVYRKTLDGNVLSTVFDKQGSKEGNRRNARRRDSRAKGPDFRYEYVVRDTLIRLNSQKREEIIERLRRHRYEAGMTNAGVYDYAHDKSGDIQEFLLLPSTSISWGSGTADPERGTLEGNNFVAVSSAEAAQRQSEEARARITEAQEAFRKAQEDFNNKKKELDEAEKAVIALQATIPADAPTFTLLEDGTADFGELPDGTVIDTSVVEAQTDLQSKITLRDTLRGELAILSGKVGEARTALLELNAVPASARSLKSLVIMVRPVSDEFGFEVIGHYRYGRGVFIDRGQVQIPDPNVVGSDPRIVNQVNIQFAPTGNLLTSQDPTYRSLNPQNQEFGKLFERMTPEDWLTGATFNGANYKSGVSVSNVNPTSEAQYTDAINKQRTSTGKVIFAEADALRQSTTLAELQPDTNNELNSAQFPSCSCGLGRTDWISVLPKEFIQEVLAPVSNSLATVDSFNLFSDSITPQNGNFYELLRPSTTRSGAQAEAGSSGQIFDERGGTQKFFSLLDRFLVNLFQQNYSRNAGRERTYSGEIKGIERVNVPTDVSQPGQPETSFNRLSTSDVFGSGRVNSLFDRAANGDIDAFADLQKEVNFGFGRTTNSYENFKDTTRNEQERAANRPQNEYIRTAKFDPRKGRTALGPGSSSSDPQVQPVSTSLPVVVGNTINPGEGNPVTGPAASTGAGTDPNGT